MRYRGGHSLDTEDELEQYSTRSSVRLTGLPEKPDENNYATVMEVFNDAAWVTPPITAVDIDRIYIAGKPDAIQRRSVLIKFATYFSMKRLVVNIPLKRAERARDMCNVYVE